MYELEADMVTIGADPDAVTIDPDADANAFVVKYEYVIVDAEQQSTYCLVSTESC
jgi:hypothetical protein